MMRPFCASGRAHSPCQSLLAAFLAALLHLRRAGGCRPGPSFLRYGRWLQCVSLAIFISPSSAFPQAHWEYGGYLEAAGHFYSHRPNPSDTLAKGVTRFKVWSKAILSKNLSWRATYDLRLETHRDIDRSRWLDTTDRGLLQPAGSLGEFYVDLKLNGTDLRVGRQEIRWGRADGYNPTDNLIPYDYLDTSAGERMAVPALKADTFFGKTHLEAAWIPVFTPTRLPLLGQRWFPPLPSSASLPAVPGSPPASVDLIYRNGIMRLPALTFGNGQWGLRWNQVVPRAEFSLSYFDGFDDIPFFRAVPAELRPAAEPRPELIISLDRDFYRVRIAGADFATAIGPFGLRGEVAYYDQTDPNNQDHVLVVVGLDRSWGDWFALLEYAELGVAGDYRYPATFPDLALRSTAMWRVERTLGLSQSVEINGAVGLRDGGVLVQPLYSRALTNRWRLKVGASLIAGSADSYLGQYAKNDSLNLQLRCTF